MSLSFHLVYLQFFVCTVCLIRDWTRLKVWRDIVEVYIVFVPYIQYDYEKLYYVVWYPLLNNKLYHLKYMRHNLYRILVCKLIQWGWNDTTICWTSRHDSGNKKTNIRSWKCLCSTTRHGDSLQTSQIRLSGSENVCWLLLFSASFF